MRSFQQRRKFNSLTEWTTFLACVWSYVPQVISLTEWTAFLVCLWNEALQVNSLTEWRTLLFCSSLSDVWEVHCDVCITSKNVNAPAA